LGASAAGDSVGGTPSLPAVDRGSVMLDTNALVAAVKPGGDAALAGRAPVVPITAAKEFLKGRSATVPDPNATAQVLRDFLKQNGGRMGAAGTEADAAALRAMAASMKPARSLKLMDSRVLASAQQEGLPVMTRDRKFYNFMQALKFPSEKF
jgi:predicted nucleic acid-binding protein